MIECLLTHLECVQKAYLLRYMSREPHTGLAGRLRHSIVGIARNTGMYLQQIPALSGLSADLLLRLLGAAHRAAVEARTREIQRRANCPFTENTILQRKLAFVAQHPAHRSHPVRHVQEEHVVDEVLRLLGRRYVAVHLGQTRNHVVPRTIDPGRFVRQVDFSCRTHRYDAVTLHKNGMICQQPLAIHGNDGRADDRKVLRVMAGRLRGVPDNQQDGGQS